MSKISSNLLKNVLLNFLFLNKILKKKHELWFQKKK